MTRWATDYRKRRSADLVDSLEVSGLDIHANAWISDNKACKLSPKTIHTRLFWLNKFAWWLEYKQVQVIDTNAMREWFLYLAESHNEPGGRWNMGTQFEPLKPNSIAVCYREFRAFFNWLVFDEALDASPMDRVRPPKKVPHHIKPLELEEIAKLIKAAKSGKAPLRDVAIILFMLDTGLRASEVCSLNMVDVSFNPNNCTVMGKGGKLRTVYFSDITAQAVWRYLQSKERMPRDPLFLSLDNDGRLLATSLTRIYYRAAERAGVQGVCNSHNMRRTFGTEWMRGGGSQFTLMQLMGHSDQRLTQVYVTLATADKENQVKQFSPAERLRRRGRQ